MIIQDKLFSLQDYFAISILTLLTKVYIQKHFFCGFALFLEQVPNHLTLKHIILVTKGRYKGSLIQSTNFI